MAKNKDASSSSSGKDLYPKELIDLSFSAESARRNVDSIVWYKRLINTILVVLALSIVFSLISIGAVVSQPLPILYGAAIDGGLRLIEYVRDVRDPYLLEIRNKQTVEDKSWQQLENQSKKSVVNYAQPATGVPATGVPAAGVPAAGVPAAGVPAAGVPAAGVPAAGVPAAGVPAAGVPAAIPVQK